MLSIATDLRGALEDVRHQRRRPTCLAFASSSAHRLVHGHGDELCVEWLYYHSVQADGGPVDGGSTIDAAREVLGMIGQPDEAFWPYQGDNIRPSPWAPPSGSPRLLSCASGFRGCAPDRWREALDQHVPVVIGVCMSDLWKYPQFAQHVGGEVVFEDDAESLSFASGHAVLLVGYGTYQGRPYFLFRNSWGPAWATNGHAWTPEAYLTRRYAGAFIIQNGATDDVQPHGSVPHAGLRLG